MRNLERRCGRPDLVADDKYVYVPPLNLPQPESSRDDSAGRLGHEGGGVGTSACARRPASRVQQLHVAFFVEQDAQMLVCSTGRLIHWFIEELSVRALVRAAQATCIPAYPGARSGRPATPRLATCSAR